MAGSRKLLAFALLTVPPCAVAALGRLALGTSWSVAAALGFLSSYAFCDAWYFLRMAWLAATAAVCAEPPRRDLFAASVLPGRILLGDIDRNGHCNNARFLRECGFGRRDLWQRNGVWGILTAARGNLVVGAQTVRYRRELSFGEAYTLETRVLCWDGRSFYVEHRFYTRSASGGKFVNAIVLVKNTVLGPLKPAQLVEKLPGASSSGIESPEMPEDVSAWIRSNELSSKALRAEAAA